MVGKKCVFELRKHQVGQLAPVQHQLRFQHQLQALPQVEPAQEQDCLPPEVDVPLIFFLSSEAILTKFDAFCCKDPT